MNAILPIHNDEIFVTANMERRLKKAIGAGGKRARGDDTLMGKRMDLSNLVVSYFNENECVL